MIFVVLELIGLGSSIATYIKSRSPDDDYSIILFIALTLLLLSLAYKEWPRISRIKKHASSEED